MKLFGYEDMIAGILLGIIMIGASGKFFTLPYNDLLLKIFLFLFLILAILDVIHEIRTLEEGLFWTIFAVVWNLVEIVLVLGYIFEIFELPFEIITMVPLVGVVGMLGVGIFLILGNIMWMYFYVRH